MRQAQTSLPPFEEQRGLTQANDDERPQVKGKDGVGAKMDHMELEREKGITIQSAATHCAWGENRINIIDTPGHVDFTIEVERAMRVLDGGVLVLCGVGGVQPQSMTVDRQMKRYGVPRVIFINKLDRMGADALDVVQQANDKLRINAFPVQLPIGLEADHEGVVDLLSREARYFGGEKGEKPERGPVPVSMREQVESKRAELVEWAADFDDTIAERFVEGEDVDAQELRKAIRQGTIERRGVPVFMGSAYKNKGVQDLLDGVCDYLPSPLDVRSTGLDVSRQEEEVELVCDVTKPFVGLAFKLEEGRYGQLTYLRVYQGQLAKGDSILNLSSGKRVKVPRLARMHSNEMEEIQRAGPGQVVAMFGVDCGSGDSFTDGKVKIALTSMHVPEPVMSYAVAPRTKDQSSAFSKAINRFQKEDPTFKVAVDGETGQTLIKGMGELHLGVYLERISREYGIHCDVGKPQVNYREAVTTRAKFDHLHKKQSGGAGQYGRVIGYIEPLEEGTWGFEFENRVVGNELEPDFIDAVEKGFRQATNSGLLTGHPVEGLRVVLTGGESHPVDSSELAFKIASMSAFKQAFKEARPVVLEPVMRVEVAAPEDAQGSIVTSLTKRNGAIISAEGSDPTSSTVVAKAPLNHMFGYSTHLRSITQGRGEFQMEYLTHEALPQNEQEELVRSFARS